MPPQPARTAQTPGWRPHQRSVVAALFVATGFVTAMDITIINVALPDIGRDLHVTPTAVGAVTISYLIAMAGIVPLSGWLSSRFGTRRVLLAALLVFTLASALCGLSQNFAELVLLRVLQGLGSGLLTPVGLAMLYKVYPPKDRVRIQALTMIPTMIAPASGPVLGGLLVTSLSWRFVFFVNVPVGLAGALFGLRYLEDLGDAHRAGRFDLAGFLLASSALALLTFGFSEGSALGWGSPEVLAAMFGGAALLCVTVVVELRRAKPLLLLRLFKDRAFRACSGVLASTNAAFIAMLFAVPLYYQYGRGLTALQSGLSTFPEAIGVMCGGQLATRFLFERLGPRRLITAAAVGTAVMISLLTTMGADTSLWRARVILFGVGFFSGQVYVSTQVAAFSGIVKTQLDHASTLFTVVGEVTSAAGIAVVTTVIGIVGATLASTHAVNLAAYRWPFIVLGCIALSGAAITQRLGHIET